MVTPIETKQEKFRSRFEGEHKDGGKGESEQAKEFRRVLLVFVVAMKRAGGLTGRYVASRSKPRRVVLVFDRVDSWLELGRNVATEPCACSVATKRPSCVRARSIRSDRAVCVLDRYVATELGWS
ncbi:hypothetical protein F2Q69_00012447 [Brassica cretica]|uniref:Uncharacterized protein n=1 Tax=Brassica cretica TaxID=69181 RepID=A0A8S9QYC4_BRACR|nr:hypothetical protein F2Q69_00012447 [Brassica cretica]